MKLPARLLLFFSKFWLPQQPHPHELGRVGEGLAAKFLRSQGYTILEQGYSCPLGEIDLIARDRDTIVFVEVKTRRGEQFGGGVEAVTWRKQRQIIRVAKYFLQRLPPYTNCRFDVISIQLPDGGAPSFELIQHAFREE